MGPDVVFGGGVFGLMVLFAASLLKRQKDTDDRQAEIARQAAELAKYSTDLALAREARAWAERDDAEAESVQLRQLLEEQRREFDSERSRWHRGP